MNSKVEEAAAELKEASISLVSAQRRASDLSVQLAEADEKYNAAVRRYDQARLRLVDAVVN